MLVAQHRQRVEVYERAADNSWVLRITEQGKFRISSIDVTLDIDDVYDGVSELSNA